MLLLRLLLTYKLKVLLRLQLLLKLLLLLRLQLVLKLRNLRLRLLHLVAGHPKLQILLRLCL